MPSTSINRARPRRSPKVLLLLAATFPVWPLLLVSSPVPWSTRVIGGVLWALCFYPAWTYFRNPPSQRSPVPFVAVIGLLYAMYYARPLIFGQYNQHWRIRLDPLTEYNYPAQLALEGWIALLLGFGFARGFVRRSWADITGPYDARRLANIALILVAAGAASAALQEFIAIPVLIAGLSRFVAAMGLFGTGLLTMLFVRRELPMVKKIAFICLAALPLLYQVLSGFVAGALIMAAVIFLSIWVGRKHLSLRFLASVAVVVICTLTLKAVVGDYRKIAWIQGKDLSVADRAQLVVRMTEARISNDGWMATLGAGTFSTTKRSANMDLMADIVRRTPEPIPYWNGGSYLSLVGLAIPRFLWPDKPTKELGQRFGHRYSILDSDDNRTSFNLPFLVEFYANFGEIGVILGMFLVGIIYRIIQNVANKPGHDAITAIAGIVLVLPLLNIESDFSLTFGGLLMDGLALWYVLRKIQKQVLTVPDEVGRARAASLRGMQRGNGAIRRGGLTAQNGNTPLAPAGMSRRLGPGG
ncbi:MAG: hypothetical protein ABI681_01475 [Gemmatimonadales bacterium]